MTSLVMLDNPKRPTCWVTREQSLFIKRMLQQNPSTSDHC